MPDLRLDSALSARGLARSRTHAARLIADGLVTVDGRPQVKPSFLVRDDQTVEVAASDHYVSRAAHKLIAALDAFGIDPAGRVALDAGASTGGFSQVLLERQAARVLAVDVGHGQLASEIQGNARLISIEGFNVRDITREWVQGALQSPEFPTLVVADLSFISLTLVIGALRDAVAGDADFVLLVKPQFEVGRTKEGVVHSATRRQDAIAAVLWAAWDVGLGTAGLIASPIVGSAGNREYLVWLSAAAGSNPTDWRDRTVEVA
jgi:23S rRNA (cytidine1920-2'-O)/16S rRNA (cytidine1409-2'-O)-methyltransferase